MPELPEVEAICRKIRPRIKDATIASAHFARSVVAHPQKPRAIERAVAGRAITDVRRRGKNIFIDLDNRCAVHVHLRMTGRLYVSEDVRLRPANARAWFELDGGGRLIFDDARCLGKIHLLANGGAERITERLGPEPLGPAFTPDYLAQTASHAVQPVKLFLLDQRRVAGLGNIYAAEALYRAGIHPARIASSLRRTRIERLHAAIVRVLTDAVQSACIAFCSPGRFEEAESFPLAVYDREGVPCGACRRIIRRVQQGGRSTYFCPGCQR
jgi:formamidopyrimidine-DNA glycosylase